MSIDTSATPPIGPDRRRFFIWCGSMRSRRGGPPLRSPCRHEHLQIATTQVEKALGGNLMRVYAETFG